MRKARRLLPFIMVLMWLFWQPISATHAEVSARCFGETGQCIQGRIREFWEQNGGLAVFGYPIAPQEQVTLEGQLITMQRFERNRIELHPQNQRPYDVQLGRLGVDRLQQQGRDWFGFAKSSDTGGCRVFAETGHAVCGPILQAWQRNGIQLDDNRAISDAESIALFGLPISGIISETLGDGKQYQVQWFERARFELHPENQAPYDVLLGLLGNETSPAAQVPLSNEPRTPLTTRLFADTIGASAGVTRHLDWQTSWRVNPLYGNNLDSSAATIDGSLPPNVVQVVTKNTYAFNRYYDRHDIFVTITEYATTQEAINTYNNINYTDIYPTETKWNESDYGGCSHKASVETINRYYIGTAGVLRCENRIAIMRVEEASVDMTQSIMVDIYANIWFGLTDLLK